MNWNLRHDSGGCPHELGLCLSLVLSYPPLSTLPPPQFRIHCSQAHSAFLVLRNGKDLLLPHLLSKTTGPMSQNLSGSQQFDMLILKGSSMKALMNNNGITSSEKYLFTNFSLQYLPPKQWHSGKDRERGIVRQRGLLNSYIPVSA